MSNPLPIEISSNTSRDDAGRGNDTTISRRHLRQLDNQLERFRTESACSQVHEASKGVRVYEHHRHTPDERKVRPDSYALLTGAKLPRIRLRDLRHSYATILLAAGEHPKV